MDNTLTELQAVWASVMPNIVPPVDEYNIFSWVSSHPIEDVRASIERTGEKMTRNARLGVPIATNDAVKYTSSILGHRAAWRREVAARRTRLNGGTNA
jgi:hypothetical protein